jgi:UDP-4-amino-4,6-dideoxy-N-acetyl-beta-L-altrosamine transaminase
MFIPYARQSIGRSDIKAVTDVLRSDYITQGPRIGKFEEKLASYCGAKYAVCVSSGTAALHIACLAAGIGSGDEAITSPITFVASSNCVLYCGGKPVFADVEKDTANIDCNEIERKISKNTKVIIPVHFAGHPCDLEELSNIAKKHRLLVIEDAAHALGATYKDEKIGSCKYSDMAIFSFHPAKHITTGEGGAVLTNRKDLYKRLLIFRNHGITKDSSEFGVRNLESQGPWFYEMQELGFNYRITDFQCALGISQLKKLDRFVEKRRKIAAAYHKKLGRFSDIDLPVEKPYARSSWHIYCIRLRDYKKRKIVFENLRKAGLGVQVHYIPVYLQPYYQKLGYKKGLCPKAEDFYHREITIPLYESMSKSDIDYVVNVIYKIFREV